ncbi:MAG: TrbG/VirB9 family P-type conjugative transfer protein [Treponema sp.]|jgi:type IV secretion system protein VirB9|nr:TrbG/VirB9 family P-type conjugative transfer protein [Treponema sp.]
MKKIIIPLCVTFVLLSSSCGTVDVQSKKIREIREDNKKLGNSTPAVYVSDEESEKREMERREANTNVIVMKDEVFVPVDVQTQKPLSREQVVQRSMQEAMVTPQNFIGGTQFYDYNEYKQYPVVCKVLSLTVIQLENGETPIGVPYLSDTMRWELTGDVWRTVDGLSVQLIMIKPLEPGLTTNMILVTNQRIYQFVLTSTRDSYMPMIKFRYPLSHNKFITAETLRREIEQGEREEEGYYLSYNYKIVSGWALTGWFKPDWQPIEAWDDGHKTYLRLPRGVLQREYPTVFEKSNYIINYRVNENIMIMDKLITDVTLRLNGKRVKVIKKKGEAEDLRRYVKRETEVIGDRPPLKNGVHFEIQGDVPWVPEKVIEYDGETHIFFKEGVFNDGVLQVIDEKRNAVEYRRMGNVITIPQVIKKAQLAYNNQILTITRK